MASVYITKSDFKAAFDCRTKLYYRKKRYPSTLEEDEYMQSDICFRYRKLKHSGRDT